ncbi:MULTISPECIES: DUF983 domain-containing protein [Methylosinus]|uniref:DUF983 domain-containing protein n=1 Tax=Methylosinus trichosporium (strain ATCC 35070 / NCIMB 11131 / UNIQEM 75 / OB3b) TaxID=595536 RepID=A0A2D2CXZ9_METT3|nr:MULTISPECIES: DUF983 domain-containing protein [Methylosinus]ATQ67608.1 DUF983 domain-containing protein [Methylosinus trichosporium OB3b]OBS52151.1 hypothetical protein A8B73_12625 [Methylosinus sp. 3S-1]
MTTPSLATALRRGVLRKCPRCGAGALFAGYLKRVETCPHCGESFEGVDADDGPAWLTIGLVAHIIVPLLIFFESRELLSYPAEMAVLLGVTIVASLALLPLCKGFFLAAVWAIAARKTS